jgi:alkylhydroperoxidase family enzyme
LYDEDVAEDGFVWDGTRVWAHQPDLLEVLRGAFGAAAEAAELESRDKAMLVLGMAATIGDSFCATAWGRYLTEWADVSTALAALTGDVRPLTERERALLAWAHRIARDPNSTTPDDIQALRDAGFSDPQILALTLYAGLRMAFSVTNDALGARPDLALAETLDPAVRAAITWGRRAE